MIRSQFSTLLARLVEPRRFIQVVTGPRQVGKTTLVRQAVEQFPALSCHWASADEPVINTTVWLTQQWELARLKCGENGTALLVLDEIQKIPRWATQVKQLWDEDTAKGQQVKVVMLGSSPLLQSGLSESLAGRFELIRMPHWSWPEMREAFGVSLEQFLFYGGYPGAAALLSDHQRWSAYIRDALIETTISRDILLMTRVDKPALLRRLFHLGCEYSGQILAYQKMMGQLQDAGNTTTLAHYLELLAGAGMITGLAKFSGRKVRQRSSSPKLQVLNTALLAAHAAHDLAAAEQNRDYWGRIVESAIGSHILNSAAGEGIEVTYWREGNLEVDFVLQRGESLTAIEVKSGRRRDSLPGLAAFNKAYPKARPLLVGGQGMPLEEFLSRPVASLID
jgi:predicted AAA+ superfamily ATPase